MDGGDGDDIIDASTLEEKFGEDGVAYLEPEKDEFITILRGGKGNDIIYGSYHNDVYEFNLGDGHDTIVERKPADLYSNIYASYDAIRFGKGITIDDIRFVRNGENLLMQHKNGSDSITVKGYYTNNKAVIHFKINELQFHDGTILTRDQFESRLHYYGTNNNDNLWGSNGSETIHGGYGDDYIDGNAGNDTLHGDAGSDRLVGRSGQDLLNGGAGDDSYLYYAGDGHDVIDHIGGGNDTLYFQNISRNRLSFKRLNNDLLILVDNGLQDSVRVKDHFLGGEKALSYVQPNGGYVINSQEINRMATRITSAPFESNRAPTTIGGLSNGVARENVPFNFTLPSNLFNDPDNDPLNITLTMVDGSPLPDWLDYNSKTHTLKGTPDFDAAGSLNFRITATDSGGLSVSKDWRIDVNNSNRVPNVTGTSGVQTLQAGQTWSYVLTVNNYFSDPDGDHLNYSLTLADGSPLPTWLQFDPASGTLQGTPLQAGVLNLSVTVTDPHGATASQLLVLNVAAKPVAPPSVNHAPTVNTLLSNTSTVENTPFSFTLPQNLFSDPDGDLLRMNVVMADGSALPNWLRYHSDTRTLSGTPSFDDAGSLNLQVVATDSSGLSAVQDWRIDVNNSNRAPNATGALNTQTLKAGQAWSYVVPVNNHFSDPDGDHLNYRITLADGSPLPSWLQYDAASHTLRGTPTHVQQVNLKILASDTEQAEAFLPLTLQIDAATQPVVPPFRPQDPNKNLNGSRGHDHLLGGSGKDILRGFSGNDTLTGGKGNDRLEGGLGNDTYIFNKGDGRDQILDQAGKDTLRLQGLQVDQLWFKREGNKLKVQVIGTQDELSVENHYAFGTPPIRVGHRLPVWGRNRFGAMIPPAKGAGQIETFRLDNGRSLSAAQADKLIQAMAAFRPQQGSHLSVPEQMQQYLQQINVSSYWK